MKVSERENKKIAGEIINGSAVVEYVRKAAVEFEKSLEAFEALDGADNAIDAMARIITRGTKIRVAVDEFITIFMNANDYKELISMVEKAVTEDLKECVGVLEADIREEKK